MYKDVWFTCVMVYLCDCVTKTADGVENESSFNEYIEIQTYTSDTLTT